MTHARGVAKRRRASPQSIVTASRRLLLEGAAEVEASTGAGTWSLTFASNSSVWSPGLFRLFELDREAVPASQSTLLAHIHPDDREGWQAEFDRAVRQREYFEHTHRIVTATKRTRTVLSRGFAHFEPGADEPLYAVGTMVDITNTQLVRKKLDDATAQLMAVWEHVQEGLVIVAMDRTIVDCNPSFERIVARSRAELIGSDVIALRSPERREAGLAFFARASIEPVRDFEAIVQRPDGTPVPVEISSSGSFRIGDRNLVLGTYRDISNRKRAEQIVARRVAAEASVARARSAIVRATEREELLRDVCAEIVGDAIVLATVLEPVDDERKSARMIASAGPALAYLTGIDFRWDTRSRLGAGPFGRCARTRRPARSFVDAPEFAPWRTRADRHGIAASLAIPVVDGDFVAVYSLYVNDPAFFQDGDIALYESLSGDLSLALRALRARDEALAAAQREADRAVELEAALEGALAAVSTTLEKRDPYTAGHQRRVAELARLIAEELHLDPERVRGLYLAALVHDIGKIAIPSEILTKPSRLNEIEYAYVKQHSQFGADIISSIPFHFPVAEIILQHHEYPDGSGYPRGLKGDDILVEARILTVADIVESMTSVRPYHIPSGIDGALAEIHRLATSRLDPVVVAACTSVIEQGGFARPILLDTTGAVGPVD